MKSQQQKSAAKTRKGGMVTEQGLIALLERVDTTSHQQMELLLNRIATRICADAPKESSSDQRRTTSTPFGRRTSFLKIWAYASSLSFIAHGKMHTIEKIVAGKYALRSTGPSSTENPFHWCLWAIFGNRNSVTKQQRHTWATQMLLAYKCDVPPDLLIGFLHQHGSNEAEARRMHQMRPKILKAVGARPRNSP